MFSSPKPGNRKRLLVRKALPRGVSPSQIRSCPLLQQVALASLSFPASHRRIDFVARVLRIVAGEQSLILAVPR